MGDVVASRFAQTMTPMLAAGSPTGGSAAFSGLMWLGCIVLLSLLAVIIVVSARRRAKASGECTVPPFTLDDLRRMREAGDVTVSEFEALKHDVIHGYLIPASDDQ